MSQMINTNKPKATVNGNQNLPDEFQSWSTVFQFKTPTFLSSKFHIAGPPTVSKVDWEAREDFKERNLQRKLLNNLRPFP